MTNQGADKSGNDQESGMGEVPDKQLHRWKGEGGALPPEPDTDDEADAGPPSQG